MKRILYALAFVTSAASAQELVKDINSSPASQASYPGEPCVPCGGKLFFIATDGEHGRELWTTDGTEVGTHIVKDVVPGPDLGAYDRTQCYKGRMYFGVNSLWSTDGTEAGTIEIFPYWTESFSVIADKVLVTSGDKKVFKMNLDGTDVTLINEFKPIDNGGVGVYSSGSTTTWSYLIVSFFSTSSNLQVTQLWSFDGETMTLLKESEDKKPIMYSANTLEDKLIFMVYDETQYKYVAWVSDGTVENTIVLKDNLQFSSNAFPQGIPGKILLTTGFGIETWWTDGTPEGTTLILEDFSAWGGIKNGDHYYFNGSDASNFKNQVIRTDMNFGNRVVLTSDPHDDNLLLGNLGNLTLYASNSAANGTELYSDDGETNTLIKDINAGTNSSAPRRYGVIGTSAVFTADDGVHGFEPWRSDGTTAGTTLLKDISQGTGTSDAANVYFYNNELYFPAKPSDNKEAALWKSDGTLEGTVIVDDTKGYFGFVIGTGKYIVSNGFRVIEKTDLETGVRTTINSTVDYGGGSGAVFFKGLEVGNTLYVNRFVQNQAGQNLYGAELYKVNTVTNEFAMVKDIYPGVTSSALEKNVPGTGLNNKMVFSAASPDGVEPWVTDGTTEGTIQLKNINDGDSYPRGFTSMGNNVFFIARGTGNEIRYQLWMTDGTPEGTKYVKEPGAKGGVTSEDLAVLGNKIFYSWTDGESGFSELWITDGTSAGSQKIIDLPESFTTWNFTTLGDRVLFFSDDVNLWSTDGTATGTFKIEFAHGSTINPRSIVVKNGFLYFLENKKIWRTDGIETGAQLVGEADLGVERDFYVTDKYVLFFKDDVMLGRELYRYTLETIAGIEEEREPELIVVYPNPAEHTLFVKAKGPSSLRIVDLSGRERHRQFINSDVSIDVSSYADGMYVVILNDKQFKFIKRH